MCQIFLKFRIYSGNWKNCNMDISNYRAFAVHYIYVYICKNAIPLIIYTLSQPTYSLTYILTTFTQGKVGSWILYIDETYNVISYYIISI